MNYLAHAYRYFENPCLAAGTGIPDWMNVVDRKNRPRKKSAATLIGHEDPTIAAIAKGCVQHHDDDFLFHAGPTFQRLNAELAIECRTEHGIAASHQAGFLGHIIIELLLDAVLCERDPLLLDRYYQTLKDVGSVAIQSATTLICPRPVTSLATLIDRFIEVRFLADYARDDGLLMRLNGVMKRVGLPELPSQIVNWFPSVRYRVRIVADELLVGR